MTTAKVGLRGQYVHNGGGAADGPRCGSVTGVNTDGTVSCREDFGSKAMTSATYVDVGGTPPASGSGDYFQAIDAVN